MLKYCFHTLTHQQDMGAHYVPHSYVRVNTGTCGDLKYFKLL